jgi:hypothetical protein
MSNIVSLANLIKGGEFRILRSYVPEALFYDTNLPYVKVVEELVIKGRKRVKVLKELEPPEIALSYLIPARVTFRYDRYGHVIPLLMSTLTRSATKLPRTFYMTHFQQSPTRYVEEYEYSFQNFNINPSRIRCCILEEVKLPADKFRNWEDPKDLGCFGYSTKGNIYNICYQLYSGKIIEKRKQITSKTISYPRLGTHYSGSQRDLLDLIQDLGLVLKDMQLNSVIRYVYAEDVRIYYVFREMVSSDSDLKNPKGKRRVINESRIFDYNGLPCVFGYEIKDTQGLGIELYSIDLLEDLFKDFIDCSSDGNGNMWCPQDLRKLYTSLTICQIFVNMLLYILTKDLYIRLKIAEKKWWHLAELAEIALLYSELKGGKSICNILNKSFDRALEELKVNLKNAYDDLKKAYDDKNRCYESRALILTSIIKTQEPRTLLTMIRRLSKTNSKDIEDYINIVIERLRNLIEKLYRKEEWVIGLLKFVLVHTLSHHISNHIIAISGFTADYLKEGLIIYDGFPTPWIYENVSGGVKAIEQVLNRWGRRNIRTPDRVEHLYLRLGECVIGSVEDQLYLEALQGSSGDIDLIQTPRERDELHRVKYAFEEEINRLAKVWGLNETDLRKQVIELLKESDKKFARFSDYNQMILTYLEKYGRWGELDKLVERIVDVSLRAQNLSMSANTALGQLSALLTGSSCININVLGIRLSRLLNPLRSIFLRLVPRSCNPVCGMCYFNRSLCVYSDPYTQLLLLNRRLLKLYASHALYRLRHRGADDCIAWVELGDKDICIPPS